MHATAPSSPLILTPGTQPDSRTRKNPPMRSLKPAEAHVQENAHSAFKPFSASLDVSKLLTGLNSEEGNGKVVTKRSRESLQADFPSTDDKIKTARLSLDKPYKAIPKADLPAAESIESVDSSEGGHESIESVYNDPVDQDSIESVDNVAQDRFNEDKLAKHALPHSSKLKNSFKKSYFQRYPQWVTSILIKWYDDHNSSNQIPMPAGFEKTDLSRKTGLTKKQIEVWFSNRRRRHGYAAQNKFPQVNLQKN